MYTDEDLENAVSKGIFTKDSVQEFRADMAVQHSSFAVDEENFKLISSFNDVFVVVACILLLFSAGWVVFAIHPTLAVISVLFLSWGLAEFFVLKRKMALPGIVLLVTFVASAFFLVLSFQQDPSEITITISGAIASISAWLHWKRFNVPITIAAGTAAALSFIVFLTLSVYPGLKAYLNHLILLSGAVTFCVAMHWDASDVNRVTGKSDVAFWLHLVAAPLIVHPVFSSLGILEGDESMLSIAVIISLYLFLTLVSVAIDRRAFMVSSLAYVLYALTQLFKIYGFEGDSFAYVGIIMSLSLLLLSGLWHRTRRIMVQSLPKYIQARVPPLSMN